MLHGAVQKIKVALFIDHDVHILNDTGHSVPSRCSHIISILYYS